MADPQTQQTQDTPAVGTVDNGYRFKGGDPSQQENWEVVSEPNAGLAPPAGAPPKELEPDRPIQRNVTSFATQVTQFPKAMYQASPIPWFTKEGQAREKQGIAEEHEAMSQPGIMPAVKSTGAMLNSKLNPLVKYDVGTPNEQYDVGASGANLAPIVIGAAKMARGIPVGEAPVEPEGVARSMTRAINPSVNEWPSYMRATAEEAGNIKAFAEKNNLPLKTQLDWSKAARAAADEARTHFNEKFLGPNQNETVSTAGSGYKGPNAGEGQTATLGEINNRIGKINAQLDSAYAKKELGQTREALANEADLVAERDALNKILYKEIGQRTGMTPEQVASLRQRYGKMYSIADQTQAAVNQRQSSMGKAQEGRRDIPVTAAQVGVEAFNRLVRGGPEGISNRAFRKALGNSQAIPAAPLPEPNAPAVVPKARSPLWKGIPPRQD